MPALLNAVTDDARIVVVVLDNGVVAMTGAQATPAQAGAEIETDCARAPRGPLRGDDRSPTRWMRSRPCSKKRTRSRRTTTGARHSWWRGGRASLYEPPPEHAAGFMSTPISAPAATSAYAFFGCQALVKDSATGKVVINIDRCIDCAMCIPSCPFHAILREGGRDLLKRLQLVICGLGGQGVVFLSRVLAEAAITGGNEVIVSETHGMAQRGGAVVSYVRVGGFSGPAVRPGHADAVLVLDESRLAEGRRFLRDGAPAFVNTGAEIEGAAACDALGIAKEISNPRGTNLVLLGFSVAERPDLFPDARICRDAIERLSPSAVCERNVLAFERGGALAGA